MLDQIRIILVKTTHPGNIGSAARAIKTMGLSNLALVTPKHFPHVEATTLSSGAEDILENTQVFETLEDAIGDCSLVIGTSARQRSIPWPLLNPKQCADKAIGEAKQSKIAIVFGNEAKGLSNEQLALCQFHVHIPASDEYSSLNLAAAVQVISYELRMAFLGADAEFAEPDEPPATSEEIERFYTHLRETLVDIGMLNEKAPRKLMHRLRRLFNRIRMESTEVNLLRGILTRAQQKQDDSND